MDTLIIETRALGTRPTAVVSADLDVEELKTWLGEAFHTVADHLRATGNAPTGLPFARYHRLGEDRFHVEAGFPVARLLEVDNGVKGSSLPAGDVAVTTHMGPYDDLEATYEALAKWLESRDAIPVGDAWEIYFSGPYEPPSQWRTDIYQPYKGV
ncbi:MAG TPA: GyrI-like domain-containing protein [Acidimicrobiia bacterium]